MSIPYVQEGPWQGTSFLAFNHAWTPEMAGAR